MERPWVLTEDGRNSRLGVALNCVRCDEMGMRVASAVLSECQNALISGYEQAGFSGLCGEGRWEAALGSLASIEVKQVVDSALKNFSGASTLK